MGYLVLHLRISCGSEVPSDPGRTRLRWRVKQCLRSNEHSSFTRSYGLVLKPLTQFFNDVQDLRPFTGREKGLIPSIPVTPTRRLTRVAWISDSDHLIALGADNGFLSGAWHRRVELVPAVLTDNHLSRVTRPSPLRKRSGSAGMPQRTQCQLKHEYRFGAAPISSSTAKSKVAPCAGPVGHFTGGGAG
jgi:hypothetical protein